VTAISSKPMSPMPFKDYARCYDLLYQDKDYAAEVEYVARMVRSALPVARTILELGSGTGRHGRLLAAKGFGVHGVERSPEMVAQAQAASMTRPEPMRGEFTCEVGDARTVRLGRNFDAVISLFHVMSYQTSDEDLAAAFETAAQHLASNGTFLFDAWHGPAVLAQRPETRVKKVSDDELEVTRTARPTLDVARHTVNVHYDIECRDRLSGATEHFAEDHLVRYLFPEEIEALAARYGMSVSVTEEFMTGRSASPATWNIVYLLRK
jgi:SAM-dependent methyltransferase